jgi:hypothetical protein
MTVNPPVPRPAPHDSGPPASTARLVVWLAAQLLILIIAAARVPLAARYPEPAEQLAPQLLLCGQAIVASLLFPWLLRDFRTTAQMLATALPFQLATVFLSGIPIRELAPAIGYVDAFSGALAIWSPLLRSNLAQSLGVALASCLTLGGGMLRYLRVEYSGGRGASVPHTWETVTPLPSTLQALAGQAPLGGWMLLAVLFVSAITVHLIRRRHHASESRTPQKNTDSLA